MIDGVNCGFFVQPADAALEASNVVEETQTLNDHCCASAWDGKVHLLDYLQDIVGDHDDGEHVDGEHIDGDHDDGEPVDGEHIDGDISDLPSSSLQWLHLFFPLTLSTRSCRSPVSPSRGGTWATRSSSSHRPVKRVEQQRHQGMCAITLW